MPYERTIAEVSDALRTSFDRLDAWFDADESSREFRPANGGWSIAEVLEHVSLTNHFLLLTLRKWVKIAERRAARGVAVVGEESDLARLDAIGRRGSFSWLRPAHMEPVGTPLEVVRRTLREQRDECFASLARLPNGVGSLCRVTMTVDRLGKIDLYQWLLFLARHVERHLQQLAAIDRERRDRPPGVS